MSNLQENSTKLKELLAKYPQKIKILRSESDVNLMDMDNMQSWEVRDFDNGDVEMVGFISKRLAEDMEVVVMAAGRTKLMVTVGKTIFKK